MLKRNLLIKIDVCRWEQGAMHLCIFPRGHLQGSSLTPCSPTSHPSGVSNSMLECPLNPLLPSVRSHLAMRRDSHIIAEICELEASFTTQEQAVAKISSMFPTVEESHIRDLYKKYHGSQAVVMSALQVMTQ